MTTISKLYPILRKTGLEDQDVQQLIGIIEEYLTKGLTTKDDLKETKTELKEDIKNAEFLLREELKNTEIRLIKWVIGLLIAQTSIMVAIIKLL